MLMDLTVFTTSTKCGFWREKPPVKAYCTTPFRTLTEQFLHLVLFGQGVYLGEERRRAGQGGPAEKQSEGLCTRERLRVERWPPGLFADAQSRPTMLQY